VFHPPDCLFFLAVVAFINGCPAAPNAQTAKTGSPPARWIRVESPNGLERRDLDQLAAAIPTLAEAVAEQHWDAVVKSGDRQHETRVSGTSPGLLSLLHEAADAKVQSGRFLAEQDVRTKAAVAVISVPLGKKLFKAGDPVGKTIVVGERELTIVGVVSVSESPRIDDLISEVYVPVTVVGELTPQRERRSRGELGRLWLKAQSANEVQPTREVVERTFHKQHPQVEFTVRSAW